MASMIRSFASAIVLVLGSGLSAAAQTGGVITGVVHDSAGQPVPGAVVTIVDSEQGSPRVVLSDLRGAYVVDRLDYGAPYDIDVSHPQFRTSHLQATANEGERAVRVGLEPRRSWIARLGHFSWRVLRLGF